MDQTETNLSAVEAAEAAEEKKPNWFLDTVQTILLALIIFLVINTLTLRVRVYNVSMQPTLKEGYLLLVNRLAYKFGEPERGDIIVFHYQGDKGEDYVKRVIGIPGDVVKVEGGVVYLNDYPLTEPYIREMPNYANTWTVPADSLFVLGDNRNDSSDSHSWGFVNQAWVVGKALMVYWPLDHFTLLNNPLVLPAGF